MFKAPFCQVRLENPCYSEGGDDFYEFSLKFWSELMTYYYSFFSIVFNIDCFFKLIYNLSVEGFEAHYYFYFLGRLFKFSRFSSEC